MYRLVVEFRAGGETCFERVTAHTHTSHSLTIKEENLGEVEYELELIKKVYVGLARPPSAVANNKRKPMNEGR